MIQSYSGEFTIKNWIAYFNAGKEISGFKFIDLKKIDNFVSDTLFLNH